MRHRTRAQYKASSSSLTGVTVYGAFDCAMIRTHSLAVVPNTSSAPMIAKGHLHVVAAVGDRLVDRSLDALDGRREGFRSAKSNPLPGSGRGGTSAKRP